ncbi:MAG: 30S ribosomal protein S20 [Nitrospirae bacterium]|nr:30S ribosomal protein S20 [Nitrospirota bacterium]MBI3352159.1 30S ribosomal protein S20 [Nitrospirota bacterium]
MPIHQDAIKKERQTKRKNERNRVITSSLKTSTKKVLSAVEEKNIDAAKTALLEMTSLMDSAASKGVIHHNTAGRRVSRLTRKINELASK